MSDILTLPKLFIEMEAAEKLNISVETIRWERVRAEDLRLASKWDKPGLVTNE